MSVKSRILQFQLGSSQQSSVANNNPSVTNNNNSNSNLITHGFTSKATSNSSSTNTSNITRDFPSNTTTNSCININKTTSGHNFPNQSPPLSSTIGISTGSTVNGSSSSSRISNTVGHKTVINGSGKNYSSTTNTTTTATGGTGSTNIERLNHMNHNHNNFGNDLRKSSGTATPPSNQLPYSNIQKSSVVSSPSNATTACRNGQTVDVRTMSNPGLNSTPLNPPVNRATKPNLVSKKASMTINLSSTSTPDNTVQGGGNSPLKNSPTSEQQRSRHIRSSPTKTLPSPTSSAIPKLFQSQNSFSNLNGNGVNSRRSPGRTTPGVTTPTKMEYGSGGGSVGFSTPSSARLYGAIGWKEKYEESEKKRNHLVTLAQKATRDYEELRRRYHEITSENEKLARRLDGATNQLNSLQKASEAVYDDYYKLKKRYEAETKNKSDALTRVDQYNKENRRLKRQSAALMMQISDPTSLASAFDAVCETDSAENDKEILFLRSRVQELEAKVVDLDSELEKTKLAEFETQESVMLMNDSVNSIKVENVKLKEQLKQLDDENHKVTTSLEDVTFGYESLKGKFSVNEEKLNAAETELRKLTKEKNILQRQSLVFMNDAMDNRLMDALNQIGDLQTTIEEQKNNFESQIAEMQSQFMDKESTDESSEIQISAKIKSLEEEVDILRRRAVTAERKLEESPPQVEAIRPPPPPPPPMPSTNAGPPPPPLPVGGLNLNNSLKSAMVTLRRGSPNGGGSGNGSGSCSETGTPPNGESSVKSSLTSSPQIDDVISQLKRGIKLKPMDRAITRKPTEVPQEKQDDVAVEEMRSILNNLRRTRRVPEFV